MKSPASLRARWPGLAHRSSSARLDLRRRGGLFRGSFTETVPVTVISDRAGLVMNPDAKVKMRGVQVGKVASIESRPDGTAAMHLAMDPSQLHLIPVQRATSTSHPRRCSARSSSSWWRRPIPRRRQLQRGPGDSGPARHGRDQHGLPATGRGAATRSTRRSSTRHSARSRQAFNGRGEKIGQTLTDFDAFLAKIEPSLPNLSHDIEAAAADAQRLRRRGAGPGHPRSKHRRR